MLENGRKEISISPTQYAKTVKIKNKTDKTENSVCLLKRKKVQQRKCLISGISVKFNILPNLFTLIFYSSNNKSFTMHKKN